MSILVTMHESGLPLHWSWGQMNINSTK